MSGQGRFRSLWAYYTGHVQAIIYVVDVTDVDRVACSRDEFAGVLDLQKVKEKRLPVLIFASKWDLRDGESGDGGDPAAGGGGKKAKCLTLENITMGFGIEGLQEKHKVKVCSASGVNGTGVSEGFTWLNDVIASKGDGDE